MYDSLYVLEMKSIISKTLPNADFFFASSSYKKKQNICVFLHFYVCVQTSAREQSVFL